MPKAQLKMDLIVDDKGSIVVKGFSDKTARYMGEGAKAVEGFTSRLMSMQSVLIGLAGGYTLGKIAEEALDVASSFEMMELKLDVLTKGRGTETLKAMNKWALEMPVNTRKAIDTFSMMLAMGLDVLDTWKTKMTTLVDVSAMLGEETMPRVARALGQMKTLGKLSAEELNQLSEAGIDARKYLTEAFGMTVEELKKSQHSIEEIIDAIWKGLDADFGGSAKKAQDSWKGMTATFKSYMEEIARMGMEAGVFEEIKTQLKGVNEELKDWIKNNDEFLKQEIPKYVASIKGSLTALYDEAKNINTTTVGVGILGWVLYGPLGGGFFAYTSMKMNELKRQVEELGSIHRPEEKTLLERLFGDKDDVRSGINAYMSGFEDLAKAMEAAAKAKEKLTRTKPTDYINIRPPKDMSGYGFDGFNLRGDMSRYFDDIIAEANVAGENLAAEVLDPLAQETGFVWEDFIAQGREAADETASVFEDSWEDMLTRLSGSLGRFLSDLIQGTADVGSFVSSLAGDIGGYFGQELGNMTGIPGMGFLGSTLGTMGGQLLGSIFGGDPTKYEETGRASAGWTDEGFAFSSQFSASNEYGGQLARGLNTYVNSVFSDLNEQIATALETASPEQTARLKNMLGSVSFALGAIYKSGFQGFSISEKGDREADLKGIMAHLDAQIKEATGGLVDLAGGINKVAEESQLATDATEAKAQAEAELTNTLQSAASAYSREIAVLEREFMSMMGPYEGLSGRISGFQTSLVRKDWGISEYKNRYDKLASTGEQSLDVLQEQFDVLQSIERLQVKEVQQNEQIVNSLGNTISRLTGGDLAPVQSAAWYGSRYASLLSASRTDREAAGELASFAPEYLNYMKGYTDNYASLVATVASDLSGIQSFYESYDFATNTGLAITTTSTNDLLKQVHDRLGGVIGAIQGQYAEAQTEAKASDPYGMAAETIRGFYETYLGRDPDPGGWQNWTNALLGGRSTASIIAGFTGSQEYKNLHGLHRGGATSGLDIVGERGWEFLVSNPGSRVVSNQDSVKAIETAVHSAISRAGGSGKQEIVLHNHMYLDGHKVSSSVAKQMSRGHRDLVFQVRRLTR